MTEKLQFGREVKYFLDPDEIEKEKRRQKMLAQIALLSERRPLPQDTTSRIIENSVKAD
jgi:hypothetical protein